MVHFSDEHILVNIFQIQRHLQAARINSGEKRHSIIKHILKLSVKCSFH